jgi:hypothetical protein
VHVFLIRALVGGELSASCPYLFTPEERTHGTRWIGGWVAQEPVCRYEYLCLHEIVVEKLINLVKNKQNSDFSKF